MKQPLERYLELMKEYPHLFQQPNADGIVIITDPDTIEREQAVLHDRLVIGVLVEDPWFLYIRDLVHFPGGKIGTYTRRINRKSLQGGFNVVILPRCGDQYLLLRHFRHDDRRWHWEFPRGFGEPGLNIDENARKEFQEELGINNVTFVELTREMEGPDGGTVFFLAEIPPETQITLESEEGISNSIWIPEQKLREWIRCGELEDMFSLKVYLLMTLNR